MSLKYNVHNSFISTYKEDHCLYDEYSSINKKLKKKKKKKTDGGKPGRVLLIWCRQSSHIGPWRFPHFLPDGLFTLPDFKLEIMIFQYNV